MSRNFVLGALVSLATIGCATAQNPTASDSSKPVDKTVAAANNLHCVKDTGSYIKRPDQQCANVPGTSYSNQEIQDTGRLSTEDALRELDPRVR